MAKVRVYELAKELGVESKTVLSMLKDMGEFVRSASSTVEAPVERRLKEKLASEPPPAKKTAKKAPAAKTAEAPVVEAAAPKAVTAPVEPAAGAGTVEAPPPRRCCTARTGCTRSPICAASAPAAPSAPARRRHPVPAPGVPRAPGQLPPAARTGETPGNGQAQPGPRPRPGSTGGLPVEPRTARRPGTPRPGNNPFSPSQGMGQPRAPRRGADAARCLPAGPTPAFDRPPAGSRRRTARRAGHAATEPGDDAPSGSGQLSGPGGPGGPGARGAAAPPAGGRAAGRGGAPGRGGPGGGPGGPPPSGRGGRGGRGGTQGAFGRAGGPTRRGRKSKKQRRQEFDQMEAPSIGGVRVKSGDGQKVRLARGASLTDLAEKIGADAASLVQVLFHLGEMVTATQSVSDDTLQVLGAELNYDIEVVSPEDEDRELLESFDIEFGENEGGEEDLEARPPVVTVMGHVDHGKTKLLDAIRKTNVVAREAGGITQAIGAYQVATEVDGQERAITFIDTPGHEAFTAMRARGAKSTDIAVLVVAADDGVMPQTIEALNHALAADVPVVVAVNKIDKVGADPTKVRGQLTEYGLVPEEYGGDTMFVDVSAITGEGLDSLLEAVVLTADAALDLRANPEMDAQGVAIEAHLDKGRGPVATVLVQRGTLKVGDSIVAGPAHGRVRALLDDHGDNGHRGAAVVPGPGARSHRRARCGRQLPGGRRRPDGPADRRAARVPATDGGPGGRHSAQDPRPAVRAAGEGRDAGAAAHPQGRRRRFGRGPGGRPVQDRRRRRGQPAGHRPRCRCDHRDQRLAGCGLRCGHRRLQCPTAGQGDRAGRPRGRGHPVLLGDLRRDR